MIQIILNLTLKKCWDIRVETSEKLFLSNFKSEGFYATDLKKMCDRYVVDLPGFYGKLFTAKELDHISNLLVEHLQNYIENLGGLDNVKYYTEGELCKIERNTNENIIENMARKCNMSKEKMKLTIQLLKM